ncbi:MULTISPECIES: carbohydrate ABC transporter permease [Metabacillus]|uniref:Sugar ABC transporter permease n=1 Tax=Metabacillus hrfriensis TaxID=3048891 RepID=A0ACD4RCD6_9BACI|nr:MULTISPECIES: sugar ABC transporter permease [Metabacillus]UAL52619.1 sugar ABC transporter permease [Metabacillus dongyingensis]UOK58295.1 sugar ABC transporter permease [Bacillus sp. OVS6]USK28934.1 sugar ABC transporter permease [Bacillus sp. CMF21]WHZ58153.1 sugar ABC transporter permease [Metabacillus sp. CT-WN-B3]
MSQTRLFPYMFIAPAVILFIVFTVYPIFSSLLLSFQTFEAGEYIFTGLDNYVTLFQDEIFHKALMNTFIIFIVQVPIMLTLALVLSSVLNSGLLRLKGFFRVSFFLPAVTSLVAYSILFSIMLQEEGIINTVIEFLGMEAIPWLSDSFWAKASIILAMTWRWTGYNMVIFLAALQNIPNDMYEAASLDGAGKIRQFFYITIPQLKPVILFAGTLSTIGTLQLFDEPFNLTKGGPADSTMTLGLYIYQNGFEFFQFGYASAIAYIVVVLVGILTFIQFKVAGDR